MNTMDTILKRQSCRQFKEEQISKEELTALLEAANASPVSMGRYEDIKLTVIQDPALIARMEKATAVMSAAMGHTMEHAAYGAPTLVLVCGRKAEGPMGSQAWLNTGCVMENMLLRATDLGLGSVYIYSIAMAISSDEQLCSDLMIPEGFIPTSLMAVGYPATTLMPKEPTTEKFKVNFL